MSESELEVTFNSVEVARLLRTAAQDLRRSIGLMEGWAALLQEVPIASSIPFEGESQTVGEVMATISTSAHNAFDVTVKLIDYAQALEAQPPKNGDAPSQ